MSRNINEELGRLGITDDPEKGIRVIINSGQKIKVTIKRFGKDESGNVVEVFPGHPKIEEITVEGTISGVFQEDWCTVYDHNGSHAIIDLIN